MSSSRKNIQCGYLLIIILLLGPVILVSPSNQDDKECGDISTDDCLKKLQTFLRLKSLPFPTEESQLNKLCSNTIAGYNCSAIKVTGPNCVSSKDKEVIPVIAEMAQYSMFMFCDSGDGQRGYLREDLLKYSGCILNQKESMDCCAEESKLMDLPVMHFLDQSGRSMAERQTAACCPVANYLQCVQTIVHNNCGEIAGNLTKEYIRRSSGEQMEAVCQKVPGYPEPNKDICKTSPPVCSGSIIGIYVEITVLICFLFAIWISYV